MYVETEIMQSWGTTKDLCELKWCASKYADKKLISVNENIGDESYHTLICKTCANILGIRKDQDLPDATTVERKLKNGV